jgi:SAM-dependent methyltransferase
MTPYDRNAASYAEREVDLLDKKPYDRARLDVVLGACPDGRPILDVGCGPGHVARYLASKGAEVIGIDTSPRMLEIARSAANGEVRYEQKDLADLDYETGSIGGVVCIDSLIHVDKDALEARLAALGRMLAPGAALLFTMYQGDDHAPFEIVPGSGGDAPPAQLYQRKPLGALAEATGLFDVVRVEGRRPYGFERPWHRIFVTVRRAGSE